MLPRLTKNMLRFLRLLACFAVAAQVLQAKTHVFLLDKSGSMDSPQYRRYDTLRQWLIGPLLESGAFAPEDKIIVRWFARKPLPLVFNRNDEDLKIRHESFNRQKLLDSIPKTGDAKGGQTDIPQGLELVISDLKGFEVQGDVLIWILTDNEQSSGGAAGSPGDTSDILKFYKMIGENREKMFHAAYLFPLVKEGNKVLTKDQNAMMMYLLHYSEQTPQLSQDTVSEYAKAASHKLGNPVITWFGLDKALVPKPLASSGDETSEEPQVEDEMLSLHPVKEDEVPQFDIRIRFKSRAVQRSISGQITNEKVELQWPDFVKYQSEEGAEPAPGSEEERKDAQGTNESLNNETTELGPESGAQGTQWRVNFDAKDKLIHLRPEQTSDAVYNINMAFPAKLYPAHPWTEGISAESEPITGELKFQLADLKSELEQDTQALLRVKNGKFITDVAQLSVQEPKPFSIAFQFRMQHARAGRLAVVIALGVLLVTLVLGVLAVFLIRTRYELTTPSGERVLAMPFIGKEYISLNGNRAAVISRTLGKLKIAPVVGYTIDGANVSRPLSDGGDQFSVISQEDNRGYPHTFRRLTKAVNTRLPKDDFLD